MVKESRTKLQRVDCDPYLINNVDTKKHKHYKTINVTKTEKAYTLCKLTQTKDIRALKTITHNTTKEYGCLNMVPSGGGPAGRAGDSGSSAGRAGDSGSSAGRAGPPAGRRQRDSLVRGAATGTTRLGRPSGGLVLGGGT